jgi:hypothetical protein
MLGGFAGPRWRGTGNATSPLWSLGAGSSSVLHVGRRLGRTGLRERPDRRDQDTSGVGCHTPHCPSRGTRPWNSAGGASSGWSARSRACTTPTPIPIPSHLPARPPPARAAAALDSQSPIGNQPSSTASMARMNRCNAWSTAITPHSTVANPGLPAARRSARTGQRRSMTAWVTAETVRAASALPAGQPSRRIGMSSSRPMRRW